jgi:HAD superfamily hydrolase (TIGR01459 family)
MMFRHIEGLGEIAGRYDAFLVDQYGVLHDGERLYAEAAATIERLEAEGKAIVVMTNSGKRAEANRSRLSAMGLNVNALHVVSSGEVAHHGIATNALGEHFRSGRKAFLIGKRGDDYGFDDLHLEFVSQPEEANFLFVLGTNVPEWSIEDYRVLLAPAARRKIPLLCCNPDRQMLTSSGIHWAPGAIAEVYEQLGGEVTYIGKPARAIFDHAVAVAGNPARERTLVLGDSISHDVVGARRAHISAGLVLTGLSCGFSEAELREQCDQAKVAPDYILSSLCW